MTEAAQPITAIITWQASTVPAVPSAHRYRASVNTLDGLVLDVDIGRPGVEVWDVDQLVHPLPINSRIHGEQVGQYFQWVYCERPVVGTCDDLPGDGTTPIDADPGSVTPVDPGGPGRPIDAPEQPAPTRSAAAQAPQSQQSVADSLVVSILLRASPAKLAALGQAIAIATQNKQA